MKDDSQRVPGYPMRYVGAKKLDEDRQRNAQKYNAHGDGEIGISVRTAKPDDADKVGVKRKPSPLI